MADFKVRFREVMSDDLSTISVVERQIVRTTNNNKLYLDFDGDRHDITDKVQILFSDTPKERPIDNSHIWVFSTKFREFYYWDDALPLLRAQFNNIPIDAIIARLRGIFIKPETAANITLQLDVCSKLSIVNPGVVVINLPFSSELTDNLVHTCSIDIDVGSIIPSVTIVPAVPSIIKWRNGIVLNVAASASRYIASFMTTDKGNTWVGTWGVFQ